MNKVDTNSKSKPELNDVKNIGELSTKLDTKIDDICEHEWVKDLIDIDPDRSKEICYCILCGVTKK